MSRLTRDGTAEPVSRDQILRHARGQGNIIFPVQLTTSRIGNLTRLIHTLLYVMTIHTYIHTLSVTEEKTRILVFSRIGLTTSELANARGYLLDYLCAVCGTVYTDYCTVLVPQICAILLLSRRRKNPHWPKFSKLNF